MTLVRKLRTSATNNLNNYLRMDDMCFNELLSMVKPFISKKNTKMRKSITAEERLIVTLRYLATGRSLEDLKFSAVISPQALRRIIPDTCQCIYKALKKKYLKFPETVEEWQKIARDYNSRWNFPNCGGAIDGKHIKIVKPVNSGSYYFNYKEYFSTVLMAIVDANYEFIYVNVGCNGRISDGGVIETTKFYDKLLEKALKLPSNETTINKMNFVFVADDAFALNENILKPFPDRNLSKEQIIFNYRLSRARRTVENAFGILSNRFRVFHTAIPMKPEKVDKIVLAAVVLHNFLRGHTNNYIPKNYVDFEVLDTGDVVKGYWRNGMMLDGLQPILNRHSSHEAKENREMY
ncbi:unnamed protein product [Acanthoscelides obtectus]|uniref:DDE Tnp4 domain-containing protein n=1 Tax=Acanthoscelides obtectus TaxID=200917 RepID=A0A9P0L7N4_ACAOB|nr:unnamed protein product [Acanthoscelides obtectus]CAK1661709.1 Protein ALP1-like [Acanthoscelides obtectus]